MANEQAVLTLQTYAFSRMADSDCPSMKTDVRQASSTQTGRTEFTSPGQGLLTCGQAHMEA
jgi:hypothetical protein